MDRNNLEEHVKLQSVIVQALLSKPCLVKKSQHMDFELFNYLVKSIAMSDKSATIESQTTATISVDLLSQKIRRVDPHANLDQLQNLFQGRKDISADELYNLFSNQKHQELDISKQCYVIFDEDGYLSESKLKKLFADMGFDVPKPKDLAIMLECFDHDCDRRVSLKDFESVIGMAMEERKRRT